MQKTVLIYDDVEEICNVCKHILSDTYRVETFLSCANLFDDVERVKPNIILMDYRMPVINGDIAIKALSENESTKDIPVILFTAAFDVDEVIKAVKVAGVLKKPFDLLHLKEAVEKYSK